MQMAYISQIVYGPLIFITKLSILLLYLRVFAPAGKSKTFLFIHFLIWSNFLFYFVTTLVKVFQCTPRDKVWDQSISGSCLQIEIPILIASAINMVSDFSILLLPIVSVWKMRMRTATKMGVSAIFLAGSL